jgi:hypothetical protein
MLVVFCKISISQKREFPTIVKETTNVPAPGMIVAKNIGSGVINKNGNWQHSLVCRLRSVLCD